jgi:protein involved in polysaccharide export with SLBB domain
MRLLRNAIRNCSFFLTIAIIAPLLTGCSLFGPQNDTHSPTVQSTDDASRLRSDPLHVGDSIRVDFSGTPVPIPFVQTEIKGDGTVHFDLIGDIQCDGLTPGELEKTLQKKYVPDYYTHLSVNVTPVVRYFYVDGEVNGGGSGGRQVYSGPITVTRAIAASGGFSPFADRRRVKLFRFNATSAIRVNCVKALDNPKLDLSVYPGDKIVVPRRLY